MNIGIGRIAEASAPYREKAKESTTATAIQAAAQEVLAQNPPESAEKIGIIGAYAQGPSDIYRFNGGKLCERGITDVALYDVSNTHVSYLIAESFKYSHIVLASVTYNLGIYPAMHDFLMDMKALNLQNRTFALIENGSWAVKSGDLMQKFVNNELKNMTVLNERLSLASSLGEDKAVELETLADAILESVQ